MPAPVQTDEPAPMELPPPRRTLLGRLARWLERARALRPWIERARERSAALDATLETIERDSHLGGGILSGALSYRLFVFVLPLAFFIVSGLGLLARAIGVDGHRIVSSVGFAGVVARQVETASKGSSNWWAALTAFFVLVYATRVLLRALAIIHSLAWEGSAASVKVSSRALGIFGAALVGQMALIVGVGAVNHQTVVGGIVAVAAALCALAGLWLVISLQLPHSDARWTDLVPGSLFYAVGFAGVMVFNVLILGEILKSKSSTYGALGIAAALLLAFFFVGRVIVGAAVLNATLYRRRSRSGGKLPARSHDGAEDPEDREEDPEEEHPPMPVS